jgi:cytochrome c peroxidase
MPHLKSFLTVTLSLTAACTSLIAADAPDAAALRAKAKAIFPPLPDKMPGADKDTPARVELGRKLYFEKNVSSNRTQSCNSCHQVEPGKAGVDNLPTSPGALGKPGGRNSPTTLNAGFHIAQFWDGRAATLEDQAKGPVLNPGEMGMPDANAVLERLNAIPEYATLFKTAFPGEESPVTYDNFARAVAAFERTLITKDRYDDFVKGDDKALSAAELKGLDTFINTGCITCHIGSLFGGQMYQKMGLVNPYENKADLGRFEVTKNEAEKYFFKVPSLRNIALTGPYFHDGKAATLEDAVTQMAWLQLGKKLAPDEVKSIVTFLNALSDKERGGAKKTATR